MFPVAVCLPPSRMHVLGYSQDEEFVIVCYIPERGDQERALREGHLRGVTHWCFLPDKPAKAEEDAVRVCGEAEEVEAGSKASPSEDGGMA